MLEMFMLKGTFSGTIFFWVLSFPAPLLPNPFALCGPVLANKFLTPSSFYWASNATLAFSNAYFFS